MDALQKQLDHVQFVMLKDVDVDVTEEMTRHYFHCDACDKTLTWAWKMNHEKTQKHRQNMNK